MPPEFGCVLQPGWVKVPESARHRRQDFAQALHVVIAQAASVKDELRHEMQIPRLALKRYIASL